MAVVRCLLSEDQFLCYICADVFTDPVTTSCGHNFCKKCITEHWDANETYLCPLCIKVFTTRPVLHVNTFISEIVDQFRESAQSEAISSSSSSSSENLKERLPENGHDHKTNYVVPQREEYDENEAELGKTEAEIYQMIQKRRLKIQEIEHSVDLGKEDAERKKAEGFEVFTSLKESVEKGLNEFINKIDEKQETTEKQAEDFIKVLEEEINELMKIMADVTDLFDSEDQLDLLQSLKAAHSTNDWTEVKVRPPSYEGTVVKAVGQLDETLNKEMKMMFEAELKRVQQFAVDVTLDPDTAHADLVLSSDGKKVNDSDFKKFVMDNPKRFSDCPCALGKQSFSSGKFYFEVQVKGKTKWTIGVVRESINRREEIPLSPRNGCWTIWLRNFNEYKGLDNPLADLSPRSRPQKVGVFVDYEKGLVSFHDVDTAALIYSFTGCCFNEKLYPFLNPCLNDRGKNITPLKICPVNPTQ